MEMDNGLEMRKLPKSGKLYYTPRTEDIGVYYRKTSLNLDPCIKIE